MRAELEFWKSVKNAPVVGSEDLEFDWDEERDPNDDESWGFDGEIGDLARNLVANPLDSSLV